MFLGEFREFTTLFSRFLIASHLSLQCQKPYTDEDVVILNGTDEDIERMKAKMESRVAARKSSKKSKQTVVKQEEPSTSTTATTTSTTTTVKVEHSQEVAAGSSTISKLATAAPLDKSLKRNKMDKLGAPEFKKAKEDYSVAEDPKASEVYKSLFTTHDTEKNQDRAHWVTYNPFYN